MVSQWVVQPNYIRVREELRIDVIACCTLPSFLCLQCHLLYEQPCPSHVEQVVMSCFVSIQSRGKFPPRAPSPLVTCNLAIVNSPRSGIGFAWKDRLRCSAIRSSIIRRSVSAHCHVRVSSSPPPGFDSDRVKLQNLCAIEHTQQMGQSFEAVRRDRKQREMVQFSRKAES